MRRHDTFKPPVLTNGVAPKEHLTLTGLDALLGRPGVKVPHGLEARACVLSARLCEALRCSARPCEALPCCAVLCSALPMAPRFELAW